MEGGVRLLVARACIFAGVLRLERGEGGREGGRGVEGEGKEREREGRMSTCKQTQLSNSIMSLRGTHN